MTKEKITLHEAETAQEFIEVMTPIYNQSFWKPKFDDFNSLYDKARWIYRGQWDSDWHLTPSAFRNGAFKKFGREDQEKSEKFLKSIENELFCLLDFLDLANSAGLNCDYGPYLFDIISKYREAYDYYPDYYYYLESKKNQYKYGHDKCIENEYHKYIEKFPDTCLLNCLSLAQHHGIPTRLLDFTYDPLHAAFFSAMDVLETKPDAKKSIAVWAIHMGDTGISHRTGTSSNRVINVPIPYIDNHYMKSQKGVLLLDTKANEDKLSNGTWKGLDELDEIGNSFSELKKITLPQSEAEELIKVLSEKYFIHPASTMPTLDNVVKTMRTPQYIRKEERY